MMRTGGRGEQLKDVSVSGWNSFRVIRFWIVQLFATQHGGVSLRDRGGGGDGG